MNLGMNLLLCLLLFLSNGGEISSGRSPNLNARDAFACNLFQSFLNREQNFRQMVNPIVLFSPAAMQKILAVFYNNSELEHMRPMARDLGLLDSSLFKYSEVTMARRWSHPMYLYDDRPMPIQFIQPYLVMDFFANDFEELGGAISVQNYFIIEGGFDIARAFQESAWDYFNIKVLPKYQPVIANLRQDFGIHTRGLEVYSSVIFHGYLSEEFQSMQHFSYGKGYFRFGESVMLGGDAGKGIKCQVLELPLNAASTHKLSLMLVMPTKEMSLFQLESKLLELKFRSFQRLTSQLRYMEVSVRLPRLKLLSKINVGLLLKEMSWMRLHKLFDLEMLYHSMFDGSFNRRIKVQHFVQSINMQLHAPGPENLKKLINPLDFFNASHTFDCVKSPFLFLVRSRDVIYFMGHHRGIPSLVLYRQF